MGQWVHTERGGFGELFDRALARAKDGEPWRATPQDRVLFLGVELQRALAAAALFGRVVASPASEASPLASVLVDPQPALGDSVRAAAARVLATTPAIYSRGQVDASDIDTSSFGGEVAAVPVPIVAGAAVVMLGGWAFAGWCVHKYADVVDHQKQRDADFAKLKQADAQALEVLGRHAQRESQAGKQLELDAASKQVLANLGKVQELLANKQTVSPPSGFGGFLSSVSPTQIAVGAAIGFGALWLLRK